MSYAIAYTDLDGACQRYALAGNPGAIARFETRVEAVTELAKWPSCFEPRITAYPTDSSTVLIRRRG